MNTQKPLLPESEAEQDDAFNFGVLYEVVRRRLWLIAACALGGLLLAAAYVVMRTEVFEAGATIQVEQQATSVLTMGDYNTEDFRQPEDLKTVEQNLITPTLIWRVIQANQLDQKPGFFKPGLLFRMLGLGSGTHLSQATMIKALSGKITAKLRKGTRLIDITAKHEDPKMAQALVRSLIDEYVNESAEWRAEPSKDADKFLIAEAERLKRNTESAEQALADYREKNRAVSLEDKQNIVVERLKDLNLRMAQAQNDTAALESDLAQIEKMGHQPEKLLAIGGIANALSVLDAQRVATAKEGAFAMISQRYGPENSAYVQAERELRQVRTALDAAVMNAADSLRGKYEAAKFIQQAAEKKLQEQEQVALELNRKAAQYGTLSREVEADRVLFESVVKRLKEMNVMNSINKLNIRIVDPPIVPDPPTTFWKLLIGALGMFGGAMIGFTGVVGWVIVRPVVLTLEQAERVFGFPVFGAIPRMPQLGRDADRLPGIAEPQSQTAEAFRFLCASASTVLGASGKGSLLLTGAARGEGNTSCAAGYAVALARSGVRTLLVDADLRNPSIGRLFAVPKDASGLADCLAGRSDLGACVVPTKVENLFVLPAGSAPPEISGLFSGPAFGELISKAAGEYGRIVIDSAPVNTASETLLIARHASAACIVMRTGRTSIGSATRACQLLERAGCIPAGSVLSSVPRRMIV